MLASGAVGLWWWQPPRVVVVRPTRGPAVQAVYATGTVEATIMLPIAPRSAARLAELDADEGQTVTKGEVLARLEDQDLAQALAQLRSQEASTRRDYERSATLVQRGLIAQSIYDHARSDWQAARAASARAAAEVAFLRLVAPADGVVIHRDGEIGQLIPVNQAVFWIAVDSPPRVSAEVDEEDIARVQTGQEVLIRADAFPGRVFRGVVQRITPKGDPVARSYRVRIGLAETTPLRIGMTAETNIVVRKDEHALLLPPGAIEADRVFRVRDGRLEARPVAIGAKGAEAVEILAGVAEDDWVVAAADASLREGEAVRAVPAPAPP